MYTYLIEDKLNQKLIKFFKKDRSTYDVLIKKFQEIINCNNIDHYKNLKYPLQEFKRVHIRGSLVLIFKFIKSENKLIFFDINHHDKIYFTK